MKFETKQQFIVKTLNEIQGTTYKRIDLVLERKLHQNSFFLQTLNSRKLDKILSVFNFIELQQHYKNLNEIRIVIEVF